MWLKIYGIINVLVIIFFIIIIIMTIIIIMIIIIVTKKRLDRVAAIVGYNFCMTNEWSPKRS